MRKKLIATRYMTRFQCVGQDCKDHCCQGWTINLDRADYDRLWDLSKSKTSVPLDFEEAVQKLPSDKWEYVNMETGVVNFSAEMSKNGKAHSLPIGAYALSILEDLKANRKDLSNPYVFATPSPEKKDKGKHFSQYP